MGWAKYWEDIEDAIVDSKYLSKLSNYTIHKKVELPIYSCAYCNLSFYSKVALYEHIRKNHNTVSDIVAVNGIIVNKECYVKSVSSLIVIRYDETTDIYINDNILTGYKGVNEVDLTAIVKDKLNNKENQIKISICNRDFYVKVISQEQIDNVKILLAIQQWSEDVVNGKDIKKCTNYTNYVEKRCLDGFYNYFVACVSTGKNKEHRYSDAFAILSEFSNILPAAKFLLKVISFKFNWIERLRLFSCDGDVFDMIYNFMVGKKCKKSISFNGDNKIFIEDELEEIIKVIINYQDDKGQDVDEFLKTYTLNAILQIEDSNQRDKICLLAARRSLHHKKVNESRRFYMEIQSPCFEGEVKEFIKNI